MPAGLKRYWQSKGRKSGGGGKRKSTALVRQTSGAQVVRYKTRTVTVPAKRRSAMSAARVDERANLAIREAHGAGELIPGPFRLRSMGFASLYGYSEAKQGFSALSEFVEKLPQLGKLPKVALAGAVLNYFADRHELVDAAAQAFLDIGAYKVGEAGYTVSGDADDD